MPQHHELPIRCYGVAVVILRQDGDQTNTLLLKREPASNGQWCQVAGAIEHGETAWQAALREVREETGLVPSRLYSGDICEQYYNPITDDIRIAPVFVGFVPQSQAVILNHEHTDFQWVTIDEACAILPFAGQRRVFQHVEREFVERTPNELRLIDD